MKVDNEVLAVLSRADTNGTHLTLVGQLDRSLYTRTNKVLEAAGGKWNKKAKAHVFDGFADDAMEQVILTGEITVVKQEFGFFPTPPDVVARLIELSDIKDGMAALEPSAGTGNIVGMLYQAGAEVFAVELLEANVAALKRQDLCTSITWGDFLAQPPMPDFERVVMNPPFAKQADIHHVLHALKFLKPDGLLVSVMSASVTFRDNKLTTDFRDLVRARGGDIEAVADGAFKSSGTMVNTVIVIIPGAAA